MAGSGVCELISLSQVVIKCAMEAWALLAHFPFKYEYTVILKTCYVTIQHSNSVSVYVTSFPFKPMCVSPKATVRLFFFGVPRVLKSLEFSLMS